MYYNLPNLALYRYHFMRLHKVNFLSSSGFFFVIGFLAISLGLTGCQSQQASEKAPESPYTYVDSTLYFAERTASISMRATFTDQQPSTMTKGYKFQFRTINTQPAFLSSISLIADGKRIFLEEGQVVLPSQKGVTLELSLENSLWLAKYPSALVQFRHGNDSYIFAIGLHQLKEFAP